MDADRELDQLSRQAELVADGDRPRAVDHLDAVFLEGEAVLFDPRTATVHHLGAVAGAAWLMCDGQSEVTSIVASLAGLFEPVPDHFEMSARDALVRLAQSGLLVGNEPPALFSMAQDHDRANDGTEILTPHHDDGAEPLKSPADWVGQLVVRLGDGDLLVAIRAEDADVLQGLAVLLRRWVDPLAAGLLPSELSGPPAFSLVSALTGPSLPSGNRTARLLPQLRYGHTVVGRSRHLHDVIAMLARMLGGAHCHRLDPQAPWVGLRAFHRAGAVVLTDLPQPLLVNDPILQRDGIEEISNWAVRLEDGGSISMCPPLDGLDWERSGWQEPPTEPRFSVVVGALVAKGSDQTVGQRLAGFARHCRDPRWFSLVRSLHEDGSLVMTESTTEARRALGRLFVSP